MEVSGSRDEKQRRLERLRKLREVKLKGVVFDVDGTLCVSQKSMFANMRRALSIQKPTDILNHVRFLSMLLPDTIPPSSPTPLNHQPTALAAIHEIARESCTTQKLRPGARELLGYLEKKGVRTGICSRNFDIPIRHLCEQLLGGEEHSLELGPVVTRETNGVESKPSPEGVWARARVWNGEMEMVGLTASEEVIKRKEGEQKAHGEALLAGVDRDHLKKVASKVVVVGDSMDDMLAGHRAGAMTILVKSSETEEKLLKEVEEGQSEIVDFAVDELGEIITLLESDLKGPVRD